MYRSGHPTNYTDISFVALVESVAIVMLVFSVSFNHQHPFYVNLDCK
jgi:hypothetical protein